MPHFLLTTFGSLGDVHPYVAVGMGLRERGPRVTIATSEVYRERVEGEGLGFRAVRPDMAEMLGDPEKMARALHPRTGSEYVLRQVFLPYLERSYEDLRGFAHEADVMVGHPIVFATPIVAEEPGKRWGSVVLQPSLFLSAYDPPAVSGAPLLEHFRNLGAGVLGVVLEAGAAGGARMVEAGQRIAGEGGTAPSEEPGSGRYVFAAWDADVVFESTGAGA
jgi:rhamnosyltransferase subunit B